MTNNTTDFSTISKFYDDFLRGRMLSYRLNGNLRIEKACTFIESYVHSQSCVLEIGCGIGIITEFVASIAREGQVWACDLSPENVWYANKTIEKKNIHFFVADVITHFDQLEQQIQQSLDLILMVDVIEHLPLDSHATFLHNLKKLLKPEGVILFTYPSSYYQEFIRVHKPQELQPIDEIINIAHMIQLAKQIDMAICNYTLIDVWKSKQYVHCSFQTVDINRPIRTPTLSISLKVKHIIRRIGKKLLYRYRRYKYVIKPFKDVKS